MTDGIYHPPPSKEAGSSKWRDIAIGLAACAVVFYLWIGAPGVEMPLVLGMAAVVIVLSFYRPAVPCILFVIFSFLRLHEVFPDLGPWRFPQMLAQLALVVVCWHLVFSKRIQPFWNRQLTLFAVFFCLVTATVFTAVSRESAYLEWVEVYSKIGIIVLVVAFATRSAADFELIGRLFAVAGALVGAVAIYNSFNGIGLVEGTRVTIGRAAGSVLGDPNDLALALLFPLSFAAAFAFGRVGSFDRALGILCGAVIFYGIICTQSRGGLLGVAAVVGVLGSRFIKSKVVLMTVAALAVMGLFAVAGISGRQSGGAAEEGIDESSEGRLIAWTAAWNMAKARPLTGVGLANFVGNYWTYTPEWDGKPHAVHSTWFGVLAETGIPGIVVFVWLVGSTAVVCVRCVKRTSSDAESDPRLFTASYALSAGLASFCVSGTFLTQGFSWPFYIIFALTMALQRTLQEGPGEAAALWSWPRPRRRVPPPPAGEPAAVGPTAAASSTG